MNNQGTDGTTERKREMMPSGIRFAATGLGAFLMVLGAAGCSTRSESASLAADSTRVYVSTVPGDVNATIGLSLKDSERRAEEKRLDREKAKAMRESVRDGTREMEKLQKETERRAAPSKATLAKDREGKEKARAEAKAGGEKKSKTKKGKSRPAEKRAYASLSDEALADSIHVLERAIAAWQDSLSAIENRREPGEERAYDLEEGAKVVASIRLENPWGRGRRPLLLHFLWVAPDGKAAFRKAVEYMPNDSLNVLTSSFGIAPTKRAAGDYNFQVYLFRELIAEKGFELRGAGLMPSSGDDEGGGM
jgi:hypothetical protein